MLTQTRFLNGARRTGARGLGARRTGARRLGDLLRCAPKAALVAVVLVATTMAAPPAKAQKRSFVELKEAADDRARQRAIEAKAVRTQQKKTGCRCAQPRLVGPTGKFSLDGSNGLSAWLDDSGARIDLFVGGDLNRGLRVPATPPVDATKAKATQDGGPTAPVKVKTPPVEPLSDAERALGESLVTTPFPLADYGTPEEARSKLVRLWMRQAVESPLHIGLLRKQDLVPRDVASLSSAASLSSVPAPSDPPQIAGLFLGPLEVRETPGCGRTVTHRLIANAAEGSPKVAAWLVRRVIDGKPGPVALVDTRHVAVFGVGRVDGCAQGLTLSGDEKMTLEVFPVSRSHGVGEAWRFETPGPTLDDEKKTDVSATDELAKPPLPTLLASPATRQPELSDPFVDGFSPRRLSGSKDRVAFGSMAFVVGGATVIAALWASIRRRRRRRIEIHGCPACGEEMSLDVADPETDGFFCPSCGKSAVTVLQTPDGPRVRVYEMANESENASRKAADESDA